jgi:hypothetical protein
LSDFKCAALTITHNEPDFLDFWLRYHGKHFDEEDIFILHDNCEPADWRGERVDSQSGTELVQTVTRRFNELLCKYDYVYYVDCDMVVVPDPDVWPGGLRQFVEEFDGSAVRCTGFNVLDDGTPLDLTKPLVSQRTHWHHDWKHLDKVVLADRDPQWGGGFHESVFQHAPSTDVILMHFGWACAGLLKRRWEKKAVYKEEYHPAKAHDKTRSTAGCQAFPKEEISSKWLEAIG